MKAALQKREGSSSELSYLHRKQGAGDKADSESESGSVTGDLLDDAEYGEGQHGQPQEVLDTNKQRPLRLEQLPRPALFERGPGSNNSRLSPRTSLSGASSLKDEKTPTARYFNPRDLSSRGLDTADPVNGIEDLVSPRTVASDKATLRERQYYGEEASPTLPSPWDHPAYSQPASPSTAVNGAYSSTSIATPSSAHPDRFRPRYSEHRSSSSISSLYNPPNSAGIHKRTSLSNSTGSRRNAAGNRLSGSFNPPPTAPIEGYNDSVPAWQRHYPTSASLSRSSSSRSSHGDTSASNKRNSSRRSSRNLDLNVLRETPPHSASQPEASPRIAEVATALANLDVLQDRTDKDGHAESQSRIDGGAPQSLTGNSASSAKQHRRVSWNDSRVDKDSRDRQLGEGVNDRTQVSANLSVYSTPTTSTFPDSCVSSFSSPKPAPLMQHTSSTSSSSSTTTTTTTSQPLVIPALPSFTLHASKASPKLSASGTRSESGSASLMSPPKGRILATPSISRRESLTKGSGQGVADRGRNNSLRASNRRSISERSPGNKSADIPDFARATAVNPETLLHRLSDGRKGKEREMLLLDVRPLHTFVGDHGRIRGSVNVNFPSLLVKRFRKGNTTSFNLDSFITTETGKRTYSELCPSGDLTDVDVCVVDERLGDKDFANLGTTGCIGAVLVSMLEKRRMASGEKDGSTELWYNEGELSSFLKEAKEQWDELYAQGADDEDRSPTQPSSSSTLTAFGSSPLGDLPTPTLSSTRLTHSASDNALASQSLSKRKGRNLPHLTLPASASSSALARVTQSAVDQKTAPPPPPGLFRSYSDTQAMRELPESGIPGLQKTKSRPTQLQRIDCSDQVRTGSLDSINNTGFSSRVGKRQGPPPSLAPPRSFQEIAMAQAIPPTKASFASAANVGSTSLGEVAYGADDYAIEPPKTPMVASHNRNISTDSTSSTGSNSQYPSFQQSSAQQPLQAKNGFSTPNNNSQVAPFNVSVIIPGFLYLGPEPVKLSDVEELESVGIKRVLNMAIECETQERWKGRFEKIATIPMRDSLAEVNVQDRIREACMLLDDADLYGKPTYVHCKAGKSRSVTMVLAYLIHRNHWPLKRAYAHVSERRKGVSPNIGFVAELMRFEEAELGSRSQGVVGSGNTPVEEHNNPRHGYFRTHSRSTSNASAASSAAASTATSAQNSPRGPGYVSTPGSARSDSGLPNSLDGRPTIVRHLSLIANTAMNLSADHAGSQAAKDIQAEARNARVRESLPPGVGFAGLMQIQADAQNYSSRPMQTRSRSRTGIESAPPLFPIDN